MKKTTLVLMLGLILALSIAVTASIGISDVRIAREMELVVRGEKVETEILSAVVDGQEVYYVKVEDIAGAFAHKVDMNGHAGTVNVQSNRMTMGDPINDSGLTLEQSMRNHGLDVNQLDGFNSYGSIRDFFRSFEIEPEILTVLAADDYRNWANGGNALFGEFWHDFFGK